MNYTNLFNTLHSEVISEDVKEDIVSKVLDKVVLTNEDLLAESINEANDKVAPYVEALSLLVNSDITNESLEEAIDEIFANETQEVIDSVTEAFQEDVVRGILIEQLLEEECLSESSPAPVGLAGLRRAAGEEPIKHKPQPAPQVKAQQPKATPNKGAGEGNSLTGGKTGSTYRYVNTVALKKSATQAREQAQSRAERRSAKLAANKARQEAAISKTGKKEPIIDDTKMFKKQAERKQRSEQVKANITNSKEKKDRVEAKIEANKAKNAAKLAKTGSSEPVVDETAYFKKQAKKKQLKAKAKEIIAKAKANGSLAKMVKDATTKREQKIGGEKKTASNVMKGIGGGFKYSDAVQAKLDKVKGNKGATKAIKSSKKAKAERKAAKEQKNEPVQQKLDLNSVTEEPKAETPKKKDTKKEVKKKPAKKEAKVVAVKPEVKTEVKQEPKKEVKKEGTKNTSTVYLKGGEEPSTKKKQENFDSSTIDQEIYSARKDALGAKGTPEYAALKKKWEDLKAKKKAMTNESLSESLATLFSSNISEATLRGIFEMVAACKKNAEKALKRRETNFNNALDAVNKDFEANKVVNPELAKKAEQEGAKKEALEQRIKKKFNKEM